MEINIKSFKVDFLGVVLIFDALAFGLGFSFIIGFRFLLYILLLLLLPNKKIPRNKTGIILICFLIGYIFLLSFMNSTSPLVSVNSALKTNFSLILYIYCLLHIDSWKKLLLLSKYNLYALITALVCIVLSNIFKFGEINYKDATIYFGASGVNFVKSLLLFGLMSIPYSLSIKQKTKKHITFFIYFISAILVLISTKRSSMLILVVYLLMFLLFNKKNLVKIIPILTVVVVTGLFFFQDIIIERISNRSERFEITNEDNLEKEWRLIETIIVLDNFNEGSLWVKVFGNEIFNEIEAYDLPIMFHNDFAVLLGGTGIIGLCLYVLFLFSLLQWYIKNNKRLKIMNMNVYRWIYLSLLIGLIIFGIAGNFKVLGSSFGLSLLGLGAIQGAARTGLIRKSFIKVN